MKGKCFSSRGLWRSMPVVLMVLVVVAAAGLGAACAPAAQAPKELTKTKIAVPVAAVNFAPFYVGVEKGFYREEGLDVALELIGGDVVIKAMIAGEYDFTASIGSALTGILQGGTPVKIVAITVDKPLFWLYAKPGIKTVKDLKGKTMAVTRLGSATESLNRTLLAKAGLDPDKDVTQVAIGTDMYAPLKGGAVDSSPLPITAAILAEKAGFQLLSFYGDDLPPLLTTGIATTDKALKEKRDLVKKVVRGTLKGQKFFRENRDGSIAILVKYLEADQETATMTYDLVAKAFPIDGLMSQEALLSNIDDQRQTLKVERVFSIDQAFDLSVTKEANQELKDWKPK